MAAKLESTNTTEKSTARKLPSRLLAQPLGSTPVNSFKDIQTNKPTFDLIIRYDCTLSDI